MTAHTAGRTRRPIRRLLAVEPRTRALLATSVALGVAAGIAAVAAVVVLAGIVDNVFVGGADLAGVTPELALATGLLVARAAAVWSAAMLAQEATSGMKARLRVRLARHLVTLGPVALHRERSGELAGVLGESLDALDPYLSSYRPARVQAVVVPAVVFVVIAVLDPWTTLVLGFAGPMLLLLLALIGGRTRAITDRRFRELRWLDGFFLDLLQGLGTLKAFGRSREEADTIAEVSSHYGRTTMEVLRTAFQTSLVMEWAATAATALVAVQVGFRLVEDAIAFGPALAVLMLTPEFFAPLRRMATEYHAGAGGDAAAERIVELLDTPVPGRRGAEPTRRPPAATARPGHPAGDANAPDHTGVNPTPPTGSTGGALALDDVWVTYPGAPAPALRGVSLRIEPGERVALVGPSGAGKTTVANLVLRFLEPDAGTVTVDGTPLAALEPAAWRRRVGWVPQRPHLFDGTVADNLRLGLPEATEDDLVAAAVVAGADSFIRSLPDGYHTRIGERGLRLSGGQRQRIAIARAVLRDPAYLVLDELTANLDPVTEASVLDAFDRVATGRTTLVIAHRRASAARADRTVTLVDGTIVGSTRPRDARR